MPDSLTKNTLAAAFVVWALGAFGTVLRRVGLAVVSALISRHWADAQYAYLIGEGLILAVLAGVEWLVFQHRIYHGATIQDWINRYVGSEVVTKDGILGGQTVNALAAMIPAANADAAQKAAVTLAAYVPPGGGSTAAAALAQKLPLLVLAGCLVGLTGCASLETWAAAHETQLKATGSVLAQVAARAALNAAVNEVDSRAKSDTLRTLAAALRQQRGAVVTGDDVARIINAWAPNDGEVWARLSARVASVAAEELAARNKADAAKVVNAIADGFEQAANAQPTPCMLPKCPIQPFIETFPMFPPNAPAASSAGSLRGRIGPSLDRFVSPAHNPPP